MRRDELRSHHEDKFLLVVVGKRKESGGTEGWRAHSASCLGAGRRRPVDYRWFVSEK